MVTLDMISTRELIGRSQHKAESDIKFMYIYELLTRNNIRNYQMLLDFLDANSLFTDEYGAVSFLRNQIEKVQKKIEKIIPRILNQKYLLLILTKSVA